MPAARYYDKSSLNILLGQARKSQRSLEEGFCSDSLYFIGGFDVPQDNL